MSHKAAQVAQERYSLEANADKVIAAFRSAVPISLKKSVSAQPARADE